ncbi:alpha-tubulin N-acetyltransferase-like [Clytia hemisphaerica]|uniref:Alpha-tubulin N-acetyltransferase n=1 Tax=Clytia hemisphaerica TaxID=252671 RepID=A0A7M5WUR5_9CNID|eukprot:TCONS_00011338-protein
MDFSFNVNSVLTKEITLVSKKDLLFSSTSNDHYSQSRNRNDHTQSLSKIIDALGVCSAKAQNLKGAITTSFKLKSSQDHLYILKDSSADKSLGQVVGMIRTGEKRLFLSDAYGQQHECQPLCVLDFYVHETKQRSGYGLKLFQHMIKNENIPAEQLAIDRPSAKFINFLRKHFNLNNPLQQVNKFVIFQPFFNDPQAIGLVETNRRRSAPAPRNKFIDNCSKLTSRNVSSANLNSNSQSRLNALGSLSHVKPYRENNFSSTSNQQQTNSPLLSSRSSNRPFGSHACRRQLTHQNSSNLSSYSRYSSLNSTSSPKSNSSPTSLPPLQPTASKSIKSHPPNDVIHRDHLRNQRHTEMHGRNNNNQQTNADRNITSLDNPVVNQSISPSTTTTTNDQSYTLGLIEQLNKQKTFGTSWNVFGIPNNNVKTSNPYSGMDKSRK